MKARIKKALTACAAVALFFPASAFSQEDAAGVDAAIAAIIAEGAADAEATAPAGEPVAAGAAAAPDKAAVIDIVEAETAGDEAAEEVDAILAEAGMAEATTPAPAAIMSPDNAGAKGDGEKLVSMAFENTSLQEVIRTFREATGANIVSGWTNEFTRPVNAQFENVEWRQGLNAVVASYGLEVKEEPRGSSIYVVREKISTDTEQPRRVQAFELKHAKANDISKLLGDTFGLADENNPAAAGMGGKVSRTVAFPSKNMVVVKGTDDEIENCRSIIEALDVPARQVYIEARFVRLNSSASKQLGTKWNSLLEWGVETSNLRAGYDVSSTRTENTDYTMDNRVTTVYRDGNRRETYPYGITKTSGDGRVVETVSGFGGQISADNFRLAISAFEQMDGAQIFSNPKIIVENETKAVVDMTTREPNVDVKIEDSTQEGGQSKISSELAVIPGKKDPWVGEAFFKYGIELEVTPRVSPSGLITVEIVPSISQRDVSEGIDGYRVVGRNQYPIISMQRLITTFTMADGKTAVIGGLTETRESNIDSGIPLLRDIPFIGPRLFGWKSRQKEQYEIIVFVTVGLADAATIGRTVEVDKGAGIGMPMNAVLGRGLLDGTLKEPGERTDEEIFNLENKPARGFRVK